jgi:hypothetical protein
MFFIPKCDPAARHHEGLFCERDMLVSRLCLGSKKASSRCAPLWPALRHLYEGCGSDDAVVGFKRNSARTSRVQTSTDLAVSEDGSSAKAAVLRKLAFLFRSRRHLENIKSSGLDIDHGAVMAANARRDLDGAVALLPEQAATVFGVVGTPRECRDRRG